MNRMKTEDIAYMAGIFDGEGWFSTNKQGGPRASIAMTDFDVIERIQSKAGIGRINTRPAKGNNKEQRQWVIAVHEELENFIYALLPFLGQRRTERAKEVLADIEERRAKREWRELYFICGHAKVEENTYNFPETGPNKGKTACRECVKQRPTKNK